MRLINIVPTDSKFQRDQQTFTAGGWNYKKISLYGFLLLWKTDSVDYSSFEWIIITGNNDYAEDFWLPEQEGVIPEDTTLPYDAQEYAPPLEFYPSDIFLCGEYSYKLLTIDYELMAKIGQYGASTCSDTYIRIFAELNYLHQKLFPYHNRDAKINSVHFKEH